KEIDFQPNGKIVRRARHVLENAFRLLKRVEQTGLMNAIEHGLFAHMERSKEGGKGIDGVFQKDRGYFNPFLKSSSEPLSVERTERGGGREEGRGREPQSSGGGDRSRRRRRSRHRSSKPPREAQQKAGS